MTVRFDRVAPVLAVRDVAASLDHYRQLGFRTKPYLDPSGEPIYGFLCRGEIELHVACVSDLNPETTTCACYIYVDDADTLYEQWKATEVKGVFHAPVDTEYGLREFAHIDPDGNLIRVGSPLG